MKIRAALSRARPLASILRARALSHVRPSGLAALAALAVLARIATATDWNRPTPPALGKAFYALVVASVAFRGIEALAARFRRPASGDP
ncbi:MAG: hypothetical protein JXP34_10475 [Planctomycetes bacterium]|nr:hypothetical protein [Planctomycetota bacterium]